MKEYPYFKISTFLNVEDGLDAEPVDFEIIPEEGLRISRDKTPACNKSPDKFPEVPEIELAFSLVSARQLRDFLNHALPADCEA
ncbi:MAG: hypothetical protein PHW53_05205 [Patescibacteria group bacterium]|nr:hypothetical protein [Patescibacteria group bacterium]